jgi:hypothetical protein
MPQGRSALGGVRADLVPGAPARIVFPEIAIEKPNWSLAAPSEAVSSAVCVAFAQPDAGITKHIRGESRRAATLATRCAQFQSGRRGVLHASGARRDRDARAPVQLERKDTIGDTLQLERPHLHEAHPLAIADERAHDV